MADLTGIAEYINTFLGAAAIGGATFAAKWIRDRVRDYFRYLEAKVARWSSKPANTEDRTREIAAGLKVLRVLLEKKYGSLSATDTAARANIAKVVFDIIPRAFPGTPPQLLKEMQLVNSILNIKEGRNADTDAG